MIAYLMSSEGLSYREALTLCVSRRNIVRPNGMYANLHPLLTILMSFYRRVHHSIIRFPKGIGISRTLGV